MQNPYWKLKFCCLRNARLNLNIEQCVFTGFRKRQNLASPAVILAAVVALLSLPPRINQTATSTAFSPQMQRRPSCPTFPLNSQQFLSVCISRLDVVACLEQFDYSVIHLFPAQYKGVPGPQIHAFSAYRAMQMRVRMRIQSTRCSVSDINN